MPNDTYTLIISDAGVTTPSAHASTHITGGSDAIQSATTTQNGLMTSTQVTSLNAASTFTSGTLNITTAKLAADSVTTAKILDNNVTLTKIATVPANSILANSGNTTGNVSTITCTAAGRALLDDADAAAQRTTLGLGTLAIQNANATAITGGTITGADITLTGKTLTGGTITGADITLTGKTLTGGTITGADITLTGKTLTGGNLTGGTITGADINLSGKTLTGGTLDGVVFANVSSGIIPATHASTHITGGSDAIQSATTTQNGLMTSTQVTSLNAASTFTTGVLNVTSAKLAADSVITSKILDNNVTLTKIATVPANSILANSGNTTGNVSTITCTAAGRALLDDADAAAQRTTLGLGTLATQNASNVSITGGTIAGTDISLSGKTLTGGTLDGVILTNVSSAFINAGEVTGVLSAVNGGTGKSSYAVGDIVFADTTTSIASLAAAPTGNVLLSGGNATAPAYGKVGLTTHVSGILPVANGGTGYGSDGIGTLSFDTTPDTGTALSEGQLRWNAVDKTLDLKMTGSSVTQQIGEELLMRVHATETILNGQVVYISGSDTGLPSVSLASNNASSAEKTLGVATETITIGTDGYVTLSGVVRGLNMSSYTAGQEIWLAVSGGFSNTTPVYPNYKVRVGYVINPVDGVGSIIVVPRYFENGIVNGSGKVGYTTGAGGTVAQITSKSTGVTLDKTCGQITMNSAALVFNTIVSFTLTNNKIEAGDVLILNHVSGGTNGRYLLNARCAAGSAVISVQNTHITSGAGDVNNLAEAIVIGFVVIKAVSA